MRDARLSGMTNPAAKRLGELIRARRRELKLTQMDVQRMGGPSTATLRLIEGGRHTDFRPATATPLEQALRWEQGSIDSILGGGDATALSESASGTPTSSPAERKPHTPMSRARHNLEHMWGSGEELVDQVLKLNPPTEVKRLLRAVVAFALSSFIADQFIEFSITREERDELLAELYRRRDCVIHKIGDIDGLEAAKKSSASSAGDENKEDLDGPQAGTPMPIPQPGGDTAGLDRANEG